ncbi:transglutaminase domain-containing protein [Nitriliruptoraceae bacterium ZYF776]|nr:transglutaminase domain-containing protein [Profundirhabdus halotolerans]
MRRDLTLAAALALAVVATFPGFSRVFFDTGWRTSLLAGALGAIGVAALVRRLQGGAFASLLVSLTSLVLVTYVLHLPNVGLLPGAESLADARELLTAAFTELQEIPAPAPTLPGIALVLTAGGWLVAHAAHELAVRARRTGLALLPLVGLWVAPLVVPLPASPAWPRALPFLAAAALVLLLGADDDVVRDGPDPAPRVTTSGVVVGSGALALALLFPWLLPGYGGEAWVDVTGANDPRGYQPIVDVADRLQLPTERDVLRIAASERSYLRLAGLDSFDGFTWRLGPPGAGSFQPDASSLHRTDRELPPEEPVAAATPVRVDVEVLDLENIYVPTPYQPVRVSGPERDEMIWSTEGGFLATWDVEDAATLDGTPRVGVRRGFTYRIEAERPSPDIDQLRAVEVGQELRERWTQLPRDYPRLGETAEQVFAAAGASTDIDRVLALQDWFSTSGTFTYDLDVPALRGDDALERFVLEDRVGYCEYFATAMAVMLREVGIPARVAVGFLPGRVTLAADPDAGRDLTEYTVSTADAHAWVEVLFPEYGWMTFEPTPRADSTQLLPREDELTPTENERERAAREAREEAQPDDPTETDPIETPEPERPDGAPLPPEGDGVESAPAEEGAPRWPWFVGAAGLLLGLGLLVGRRRHAGPAGGSPADRVLHAQRELFVTAERYGVGRRPAESAVETAERWEQEGRVDGRASRFAGVAQAAAFGGDVDEVTAAEAEQVVADLEQLLRDSVPPRDRALAPVRRPLTLLRSGLARVTGWVLALRDR